MAKCYTFFFYLLTYEKNRNKCPFCDIFDQKGKKRWQESLIFAFFFVSLPLKTINSYNYGKRKKRWQKNEQSATH